MRSHGLTNTSRSLNFRRQDHRPRNEPHRHERGRPPRPHSSPAPRTLRRPLRHIHRRRLVQTPKPRRARLGTQPRPLTACVRTLRRAGTERRRKRRPNATARSRRKHGITGSECALNPTTLRSTQRDPKRQPNIQLLSRRCLATPQPKPERHRSRRSTHRHAPRADSLRSSFERAEQALDDAADAFLAQLRVLECRCQGRAVDFFGFEPGA